MMYEITEVVRLKYFIAATSNDEAMEAWQELVGKDRPNRKLILVKCKPMERSNTRDMFYESGRPRLELVRPTTEGE